MEQFKTPATVILLSEGHNEFMREWLERSPFVTNETADMFEALEDLSDFTVRSRPNVVLLEVESLRKDYFTFRNMMTNFSDDFPVLCLSDSGNKVNDKKCFEGNLAEVQAQITKVMPKTFAKTAPAV